MKTSLTRRLSALVAAIAFFVLTASGLAATVTWTGSGTTANWSDPANWTPGIPAAGDTVLMTGFNQPQNTNDLPSMSLANLTFENGDFFVYWPGTTTTSTNVITITSGITNTSGNNQVYNTVTLGGAVPIVSSTMGNILSLRGGLNLGANQGLWTGEGDHTLAGPLTSTGSPDLIKTGTGRLNLNNGNAYTGTLYVNAGSVSLPGGWSNPSIIGNVSIAANATLVLDTHPYSYGTVNWTTNAGLIDTGTGDSHLPNVLLLNGGTVGGSGNFRLGTLGGAAGTLLSKASAQTNSVICSRLDLYADGNIVVEDGTSPVDLSILATITGSRPLIKTGAGNLEIGGLCTYSGTTYVNQGKLTMVPGGMIQNSPLIVVATGAVLDASANPWNLNASQTLAGTGSLVGDFTDIAATDAFISPGGNLTAGTLTFSNSLSLNGTTRLKFDLAGTTTAGAGVNDLLVVSNLVANGTTLFDFSFLAGIPVNGGTYSLIKYTEFTGSELNFGTTPSTYTYTFVNDTASKTIKVTVSGTPTSLTWKGDGSANIWDINSTPNWLNGGTPSIYVDGSMVTFDATGFNTPNINLQATVQPTKVTVTGANSYTFDGPGRISGTSSFEKSGSSRLTLLTDNDFTGPMNISGGSVLVGDNTASGALGSGFTTNNALVIVSRNNGYTYTGTMLGSGSTVVSNGTLTIGNGTTAGNILTAITNNTTVVISRNDSPSVPGPITGPGLLRLPGGASARLQNVNTPNMLEVGTSGGTPGNLLVAAGDNVTVGRLFTGQGGGNLGHITQSGGVINVTDSTDGEGPFRLSHWSGGPSIYNMTGGELWVTNGVNSRVSLGIDGTGVWNMNGGVANVNRVDVNGRNSGGGGILNLTNGTINVGPGGLIGNAPYTLNLAGGTLGALANWSTTITGTLANASSPVTFDPGPYIITYSGPLTGPGGLIKAGPGAVVLNGSNTFTGTVTVNGGSLGGTSIVASVVVQPNGFLTAGGVLSPGTLAITNNLTLADGGGLSFDLGSNNTVGGGVNDLIVVRSNVTFSGNVPVALNFLGIPFTGGAYTLLTNVGSQTGTANFYATNNQSRYSAAFAQSANRVTVTLSGSGSNLVWKGDGGANLWNVVGASNWLSGGAGAQFYQADTVLFDDSAANQTVNLVGALNPLATTVAVTNNNYLLTGAGKLSGPTGITKSGPGSLTVATANDFAGPVIVNGGTLIVTNGGSFATTLVTNNASLVYNRTTDLTVAYNTRGTGTAYKENTNTLTMSSNQGATGGVTVNRGTLRVTTGNFGGTFAPLVVVNTNGTVLGNGTHALGGGTTVSINRGTWLLNAEDYKQFLTMQDGLVAQGPSPTSAGGELRAGFAGGAGTFNWNISNSIAGSVINTKLNTIGAAVNLNLNVFRGAAASDLTINGALGNAGNIVVQGNGITTLTCPTNTFSGSLAVNSGTLKLSPTFLNTNVSMRIGATGTGVLDVTANNFNLASAYAQTLFGSATVLGNVTAGNLAAIAPGTTVLPGTLTVSGTLSLSAGTNFVKVFTPGITGSGVNDLLQVNGDLNVVDGTQVVVALSPYSTLTPGTYRIIQWTGNRLGTGTFTAVAPSSSVTLSVVEGANYVDLVVGGNATPLVWSGDGSANAWNVATAQNWNNQTALFYNSDAVTFDDSSANTNVNITATVAPSSIVVNTTNTYTFGSTSKITGNTGITKTGSGMLWVTNSNNDFSGPVMISGGTLKAGNATALGLTNGTTVITNGGTLDVNGFQLVNEKVFVSGAGVGGAGAIIRSAGSSNQRNLTLVELKGDTTIGGASGLEFGRQAGASFIGNGFALTKVGANQFWFTSIAVDSTLGDINVNAGLFGVNDTGNSLGDPAKTLTIAPSAIVNFYSDDTNGDVYVKNYVLNNGTFRNDGGNAGAVLGGAITLNGATNTFACNSQVITVTAPIGGTGTLIKSGGQPLRVVSTNAYTGDTLITGGALSLSNYGSIATSPNIVLAGGSIATTLRADTTLTLASGQTLRGSGTVNGSLVVSSGSTVFPGYGTNVATLSPNTNVVLNGGGTYTVVVNNATNATGRSLLSIGGSLDIQATAGSKFTIKLVSMTPAGTAGLIDGFESTGTYTWVIATNVNGILNFDAAKFVVDTTGFANPLTGTFSVAVQGNALVLNYGATLTPPVIGGYGVPGAGQFNLVINGPNGQTYKVLTSTNVTLPVASWDVLTTGTFTGSAISYTDTTATNATKFYRITSP